MSVSRCERVRSIVGDTARGSLRRSSPWQACLHAMLLMCLHFAYDSDVFPLCFFFTLRI